MPRPKRSSQELEDAKRRLSVLISIDPHLDLGNGVTVEAYANSIQDLETKVGNYNTLLTNTDVAQESVETAETTLKKLTKKLSVGLAHRFGPDSSECERVNNAAKSRKKRSSADTANDNEDDAIAKKTDPAIDPNKDKDVA